MTTTRPPILCLLAFCVLAAFRAPSPAHAQEPGAPPAPWPLRPLIAPERQARMDFFIGAKPIRYAPEASTENARTCNDLLKSIRKGTYRILSPEHVFPEKSSEEDALFPQCPALNIDTIYNPPEEAENYIFKSTPPFNREYYKLPAVLGENIWGLLAEGGALECGPNHQDICRQIAPHNRGHYTTGSIFDTGRCRIVTGPAFKSGSRVWTNTTRYPPYRETPSFYGFLQIKRNVYRFAFDLPAPWENFHRVVAPDDAALFLTSARTQKTCAFLTDDRNGEPSR